MNLSTLFDVCNLGTLNAILKFYLTILCYQATYLQTIDFDQNKGYCEENPEKGYTQDQCQIVYAIL